MMDGLRVDQTGEFKLIDGLRDIVGRVHPSDVICGLGDDAAVWRGNDGMVQVVTTDAFVEGYHFDLAFYAMREIGYKAMAVNISDIAAMNATPRYATVAVGLPGHLLTEEVFDIYRGLQECAQGYGVQIVGGDTTRSPVIMISITVIGTGHKDHIGYRSGGQPGDLLCVTGPVGAAVAGLRVLQREKHDSLSLPENFRSHVVERHLRPVPRMDLVTHWNALGIAPNSLIDVSDGLAAEIHHICEASACGARVELSALPISEATRSVAAALEGDPVEFGLFGGDDYELVFTASERAYQEMNLEHVAVIGQLTPQADGLVLVDQDGHSAPLPRCGHDHFAAQ